MKIYTVKEQNEIRGYFSTIKKAKEEIERTPGKWVQEIDENNNQTGQYITEKTGFFESEIRVLGWVEVK